jgi:hypothetical protein
MKFFKKRAYLIVLLFWGLVVTGCGQNLDAVSEVAEVPTQISITLYSQLEMDSSLEPATKLQALETEIDDFGEVENRIEAHPRLQKNKRLQFRSGRQLEFKTDNKYQSIQRYENMKSHGITIEKSPQNSQIRKTIKVQDKPLIFAGRGYNISAFERETKPVIDVDYATHLVPTHPEPTGRQRIERLDPEQGYSRDTKSLVYNSTRFAFRKLPPPFIENKYEYSPKAEPIIPAERNPDSVLLFPHGEKSILVLRKTEQKFDLLTGNELLNKKQFNTFKAPRTSNKISNIRQ